MCPRLAPRDSWQCHGGFTQGSSLPLEPPWGSEQGWAGGALRCGNGDLCGRALVPTQTFPVEVFGPVWDFFFIQAELWHYDEGFLLL